MDMQPQIGVMIERGPQDWAILQQKDGYAAVEVSGRWATPEGVEPAAAQVYVRIVREETGEHVVPWTPAGMGEGSRTWRLRLEWIPAGGLYRLDTSLQLDGNPAKEWNLRGDMIHHLGVGDLWVIAGQSNAAGYGKGPVCDPPELGIHLLRNSGRWDLATHPFNDSTGTIHPANRERANPGHSPFLAFARLVKRETGWPVGLVQAALGGSSLGKWNPEEDGVLYRMMRDIVDSVGGCIRGVLWYQGCSEGNSREASTYLARFRTMVEAWRRDYRNDALPVITVQLNRYAVAQSDPEDDVSWGTVRELQRRAAKEIPHVAVVPALDCPLSDEIHNSPAGNLLIGERMARAALAQVYGRPVHDRAPEIREALLLPNASERGAQAVEPNDREGGAEAVEPNDREGEAEAAEPNDRESGAQAVEPNDRGGEAEAAEPNDRGGEAEAVEPSDREGGAQIALTFDHVKGYLLLAGPLDRTFTVEDAEGKVPTVDVILSGPSTVLLTLGRPLVGEVFVHGAYERNPGGSLPLDSSTYMPMLAFYRFPVTAGEPR